MTAGAGVATSTRSAGASIASGVRLNGVGRVAVVALPAAGRRVREAGAVPPGGLGGPGALRLPLPLRRAVSVAFSSTGFREYGGR